MLNYTQSSPTLTNVTFGGNDAAVGGAISNSDHSNLTLANVILWGNTAPSGAGIYNSSSTPQISHSDIQGCGGSGSWNSACGVDGGGNIEADPLFVDAASGNLRLGFGSPAIDAGTNTGCPATDLDGLPRPSDGDGDGTATCDMGAYEAGEMIGSIAQGNTYTFANQSGMSIQVTTLGSELAWLYVDEMERDHPNGTVGLKTGRYWLIRGLQSDRQTDASGYTLALTLVHDGLADPIVCRYTGVDWDCGRTSFTSSAVMRAGVTTLSDWAVGSNVQPPAAPSVTIALDGDDVVLEWLPVTQDVDGNPITVSHYEVWRSLNPYCIPGEAGCPEPLADDEPADTLFVDADAALTTTRYFYQVRAVSAADVASASSNEAGKFGFTLAPGVGSAAGPF